MTKLLNDSHFAFTSQQRNFQSHIPITPNISLQISHPMIKRKHQKIKTFCLPGRKNQNLYDKP